MVLVIEVVSLSWIGTSMVLVIEVVSLSWIENIHGTSNRGSKSVMVV